MARNVSITRCHNNDEVQASVSSMIHETLAHSKRRHVTIGVSGGSMVKFVTKALLEATEVDWPNVHIVIYCQFEHSDSNYGSFVRSFDQCKMPQFITIDPSLDLLTAALDYERRLAAIPQLETIEIDGRTWPRFDLLLLGVGPDGHTCSLFPDHPLLMPPGGRGWVAAVRDSPKPPSERVTLTAPVLNIAHACAFVLGGSGKQAAVDDIFSGSSKLPAAQVKPAEDGRLIWIVDENTISIPDSVALAGL